MKNISLHKNILATPTPAQMLCFLTVPLLSVSQGLGLFTGSSHHQKLGLPVSLWISLCPLWWELRARKPSLLAFSHFSCLFLYSI